MLRFIILLITLVIIFSPAILADTTNYTPDSETIILTSVPDVRQSTSYSCGASSFQAVLNYWGIDKREDELIEMLNTTYDFGTPPYNIVRAAKELGLNASLEENMTIGQLKDYADSGVPVIVDAQAWNGGYADNGTWITVVPDDWRDIWEDGHYMVLIGIDDKNVYLEDPAELGTRNFIPIEEFNDRWHDFNGGSGTDEPFHVYEKTGIIIIGDKPASYPEYTKGT